MTAVIDASAALPWCIPDEYDADAEQLLEYAATGEGIVPALWLYELQNALRSAHHRKRISEATVREALANLAKLPIRVADVPQRLYFGGETALALEFGISVYDAVYLDLARRIGAHLASRDARVLAVADRLHIPRFKAM